jgi:hypothetical protein
MHGEDGDRQHKYHWDTGERPCNPEKPKKRPLEGVDRYLDKLDSNELT